jgi:hypothetical protein
MGVVLILFIGLTFLSYFLVYRFLMLGDSVKDFFNRLKMKNKVLFCLAHFAVYVLSCFVLLGVIALKNYLTT